MPNWNSIQGKWYPAKEYVVDPNAPKGKEIYEGPCRVASEELKQAGSEYLGEDYHMNIDLMTRARTLGFKDVDEYLATFHQYNPEKAKKEAEKVASSTVVDHKGPSRKKGVKEVGGGYSSGESTLYGEFGKPESAMHDPRIASRVKE